MNRSCYVETNRQILWDKASSLSSLASILYALSFWNLRFVKNLLASFPFSNSLELSLLSSHVKNVVIGNGRTWFLHHCVCEVVIAWFPGPCKSTCSGGSEEQLNKCLRVGSWLQCEVVSLYLWYMQVRSTVIVVWGQGVLQVKGSEVPVYSQWKTMELEHPCLVTTSCRGEYWMISQCMVVQSFWCVTRDTPW